MTYQKHNDDIKFDRSRGFSGRTFSAVTKIKY